MAFFFSDLNKMNMTNSVSICSNLSTFFIVVKKKQLKNKYIYIKIWEL